jgi:hypothetical protein
MCYKVVQLWQCILIRSNPHRIEDLQQPLLFTEQISTIIVYEVNIVLTCLLQKKLFN